MATCPVYLTVKEFAQAAGLAPAHVWKLVRCGELPAQRFGRWVRLPVSALGEETARYLAQFGNSQ